LGLGDTTYFITNIGYRYTWLGYWLNHDLLILSGIILFGHSAMDRALGYGLKYTDSFQHTFRLGREKVIPKQSKRIESSEKGCWIGIQHKRTQNCAGKKIPTN
jgi:hypothetical protein